jgi:prepilin-type N-terminal cleavage/methylation domain-containing protein
MKTTRTKKAFTLVELLVTMVVTGIILSAVATLAFAMSSASRSSDDAILQEALLRQTRLRIGELLRTCKLICAAPGNDLAIWQTDTNDDGQINVSELVYMRG